MRQIFLAAMWMSFSILSWAQSGNKMAPMRGKVSSLLKLDGSEVQFTAQSPLLMDYKKLLNGKKREFSPNPKDVKALQNKMYKAEGGVSDGGGNAVGGIFFDFYENKGTVRLSPQAVVRWNEATFNALKRMNALTPAAMDLDGKSFGELVEAAVATKTWYLEPKPLDEQSCRNDSFIYVVDRVIVGCQNDFEVRLNAHWILNVADDVNQAGLVVHEALLAWARGYDDEKVKSKLEYKVRDLNRLVFEGASSQEFVAQLNKYYRILGALDTREGTLYKQLPRIRKQSVMEMCAGQPLSYASAIQQLKDIPKVKSEFELSLGFVEQYSSTPSQTKEMFCIAENQAGMSAADAQTLSESCQKRVVALFQHYKSVQEVQRGGGLKALEVLVYGGSVEDIVDTLAKEGCGLQAARYFGSLKNNYEKKAGN